MSDFTVRPVEESELRTASTVFLGALHMAPLSDEKWRYWSRSYEPGRTQGAFSDGQLIGAAVTWGSRLTLPGGGALPMAAVTGVGVRADHTRRGVLTELMTAALADAHERGEPLAGLHATEAPIYGRFGYGMAIRAGNLRINRRAATLRADVPRLGQVRLVDPDEALRLVPAIYERALPTRPGLMSRSAGWWALAYEKRLRGTEDNLLVAVHSDPDGATGFVTYSVSEERSEFAAGNCATLRIRDFQTATATAATGLWRYLLGVDLVDEIFAWARSIEEPLPAMLTDPRAVRTTFEEGLWLRLVDVPRALAGRTYGTAEPVVLDVRDRLLPANSGRYRISPHGTEPTTEPPGLVLDVEALAMLYLGAWPASTLATAGRIEVADPDAVPHADRLFASPTAAMCSTMF
ncbi:GNAT family N-acetyltransferase [Actinophytocola sp.]|uniref:GNAT family N-acetyltransferase n=1 Tax=Actinophytocola sp. TaxID=1872138 RepID=UPI002D7F5185|nr:GNAT family N-acetyltransferase [Actinophytocola sp.]HET9140473.1 GNAT family N-acetyltransferase [Actinophytocola sp.]